MNLSRRFDLVAYGLAPLALLLGVAVQRYNVVVHDQTSWAGGGYGMFSTVDPGAARLARAYVLTDQGPALVPAPLMGVDPLLLTTQPRADRLQTAAKVLSAQSWVVYDASAYEDLLPYFPDYFQSYLEGAGQPLLFAGTAAPVGPHRVALPPHLAPGRATPSEVEVTGARVEVWRPAFDRSTGRLIPSLIRAATARTTGANPSSP